MSHAWRACLKSDVDIVDSFVSKINPFFLNKIRFEKKSVIKVCNLKHSIILLFAYKNSKHIRNKRILFIIERPWLQANLLAEITPNYLYYPFHYFFIQGNIIVSYRTTFIRHSLGNM